MVRQRTWVPLLAMVAMLVLAAPALAGGWAVVTLDTVPAALRAEQSLSLGFMVRQHGVTPVDVHTWDGSMPVFTATNAHTGETLRVHARKEGMEGHYVVDVTFPSAGAWDVKITPGWFAGTELGTFTVMPAATATATPTANAWAVAQPTLRFIGGGLVLAALGLFFIHKRDKAASPVPALGNK